MTSNAMVLRLQVSSYALTEYELADMVGFILKEILKEKLSTKAYAGLFIHRGKYMQTHRAIKFQCEYIAYTASDMRMLSMWLQKKVRHIVKEQSDRKRNKLPYLLT